MLEASKQCYPQAQLSSAVKTLTSRKQLPFTMLHVVFVVGKVGIHPFGQHDKAKVSKAFQIIIQELAAASHATLIFELYINPLKLETIAN